MAKLCSLKVRAGRFHRAQHHETATENHPAVPSEVGVLIERVAGIRGLDQTLVCCQGTFLGSRGDAVLGVQVTVHPACHLHMGDDVQSCAARYEEIFE